MEDVSERKPEPKLTSIFLNLLKETPTAMITASSNPSPENTNTQVVYAHVHKKISGFGYFIHCKNSSLFDKTQLKHN